MDELEKLMASWDEAATPNESGFHNGGGFAMENWAQIKRWMETLIFSQ